LEARGVQVCLLDPRQAKRAPGRPKTDRLDCQWLQRLHAYGLRAAAFRPTDQICVLRSSLRHCQMLLTYGAHHIQHMHKALQQMHLTLSQVVRDLPGHWHGDPQRYSCWGTRSPHAGEAAQSPLPAS
jgi:hypothetical protein